MSDMATPLSDQERKALVSVANLFRKAGELVAQSSKARTKEQATELFEKAIKVLEEGFPAQEGVLRDFRRGK